MIGSLITGGLSFVSGLFGRSSAKKKAAAEAKAHAELKADAKAAADVAMATPLIRDTSTSTTNSLDLKALTDMALANGYNPMSIINAGGLSAFTSTQTDTSEFTMGHNATAGLQAVLGVGGAPTTQVPSIGSIVTGALSDGYSQYRADSQAAAERASRSAGYFPPSPVPTFSDILRGGGTLSMSSTTPQGGGMYDIKKASQTPSMPWLFDTDPGFADAESVETEYGDNPLVSIPYSGLKAGMNLWRTATGMNAGDRHKMYADIFNNTLSSAYGVLKSVGNAVYTAATEPGTGKQRVRMQRGEPVYEDRGYVSVPR